MGSAMATEICSVSFHSDGSPLVSFIDGSILFFMKIGLLVRSAGISMLALISCWTINDPSAINNMVRGRHNMDFNLVVYA